MNFATFLAIYLGLSAVFMAILMVGLDIEKHQVHKSSFVLMIAGAGLAILNIVGMVMCSTSFIVPTFDWQGLLIILIIGVIFTFAGTYFFVENLGNVLDDSTAHEKQKNRTE